MSTTSQVGTPKHNTKRKMKTIAHPWLITILCWRHTNPNFTVGKAIIVRLASCVGVVFRTVFSVISGCTSPAFQGMVIALLTKPQTLNLPTVFLPSTVRINGHWLQLFKILLGVRLQGSEKNNNNNNLNSSLSFEQARRTSSLSQLKGSLANDEGDGYENVT